MVPSFFPKLPVYTWCTLFYNFYQFLRKILASFEAEMNLKKGQTIETFGFYWMYNTIKIFNEVRKLELWK